MPNQFSAYTGPAPHATYYTSPVSNEPYEDLFFSELAIDVELFDGIAPEMFTPEGSTVAQDTFANSLPLNNDNRLPQQEIVFSTDAYYLSQDFQVSPGESSNSSPSSSPSTSVCQFYPSIHDSGYEYPSPSPSPTFRRREVSGGTPTGKRQNTRATKVKTCQYPHCGFSYSREQDFKRHIKSHSIGPNENCLPTPPTSSPLPPSPLSPPLPRPLRRREVRGSAPLGRRSGTRADRCQCPFCNRTYSREQDVRRHIKSHSKDRNELCSYCPKDFKRKDSLLRHQRKCMLKNPTRS